jgi:hypothetical protein
MSGANVIAHGTIGDLQKGEGDSGKESATRGRKEGTLLAQTDKLTRSKKGEHSKTGRRGGMILATVRLRL